jgi:hypothetical protein
MKYITGFLMALTLISCSNKVLRMQEKIEGNNWVEYKEAFDAGFILTFKYPKNIVLADIIDNCRCVGEITKEYDANEASERANTNQWCVCMHDTADSSINYLISSWKATFNGEVEEYRDTVTIGNINALRVTLKSKEPHVSYRQLLYLEKYSTLFEIMNVDKSTNENFEVFCESIKIEGYKKP